MVLLFQKIHEQQVHEKPHPCKDCRVRFATVKEVVSHQELGFCKQSRTCYICGHVSATSKAVREHMAEHHIDASEAPSEAVAQALEQHLARIEEQKRIEEVLGPDFNAKLGLQKTPRAHPPSKKVKVAASISETEAAVNYIKNEELETGKGVSSNSQPQIVEETDPILITEGQVVTQEFDVKVQEFDMNQLMQ